MARRLLTLFLAAGCLYPASAAADWVVSPYIGVRFAASTTLLGGREGAEENKYTFGASAGLLTDGILGVEGDVCFVPTFFKGGAASQSGGVTLLMGNVVLLTPLSLAQYGLRPYVVGGVGLMHAYASGDVLSLIDSDLFGMNIGGGAIGPISPRSSVRFDLRYFRNLTGDQDAITASGTGLELSFWRATVGLTFRF